MTNMSFSQTFNVDKPRLLKIRPKNQLKYRGLMSFLYVFRTANTSGSILTNGSPRQMNLFNKLCSYIMQDDLLQPHLTVLESLIISAHLKLGNELPIEDKLAVVSPL